jgi:glutaredoxin
LEVTLYTVGCPNCKILEKMLNMKSIKYSTITDINFMIERGFKSLPQLEADNVLMDYDSARVWVNKYNDNI